LVLRSGGVLVGQITQAGERYLVRGDKSQLDVAASQVLLVAKSLEDAYEQQRGQTPRPTAESHLVLAEWCLRYNLLDQAKRELADARQLDDHSPRLGLLERRLAVVLEPRAATTNSDAEAARDKLA